MKKILTILFIQIIFLVTVFSQSVNMQTGNYTVVCGTGATFYDNGGSGGQYTANQDLTLTVCPDNPGSFVNVTFSAFDVETSFDYLEIYNGPSTASPLFQQYDNLNPPGVSMIQSNDPSGCLTFVFHSDGSVYGDFEALFACSQPCQTVNTVFDSSSPSNDGIYTNACQNSAVIFNTHGSYPQSGTGYVQSDVTSTFHWDYGDGTSEDIVGSNTTSHIYTAPGIYDVDLRISDINGCLSNNPLDKRVRISDTPIFNATANDVCLGDDVNLVANPTPTEIVMSPPSFVGDTVTLPDGVGVCYESTITYDIFDPTDQITSGSDIQSICMALEHTFVGDLGIYLECPDGTVINLKDDIHSGGADFGNPPTPFDYCFTEIGPPANTVNDLSGGATIPAGDYLPDDSFSDLIGCPLNGTWIVRICDNWASDDGTIYGWEMSFDPSLYGGVDNYTPSLNTGTWTGTGVNAPITNPTTATPTSLGTESYTISIVDEFGCPWDTTVTINVTGIDVTTAFTDPTCNGVSDGTASVTNVTGNVGTVSYLWSANAGNATTAAVTGLGAGTYTVTVTDGGASCTNVQTIILTDPAALIITLTPTAEVCGGSDGEINVNVTNAVGVVDYTWQVTSGTGTTNGTILDQANPFDITGLQTSTYSVTATDVNGCIVTGSIVVPDAGNVVAGFSTSANQCLEGNTFDFINTTGSTGPTITTTYDVVAPVGGTSSTGLVGSPNYTPFIADASGVWTVTQTVQDGACSDTQVLTFTVYDEPQLSLVATDLTCNSANTGSGTNDGTITASVINSNGAETYTIISGTGSFLANIASGLTANTYQVVIVDMQGCNDTASITISEPPVITLSLTSSPNLCNGTPCNGTANVASATGGSSGPFTYLWNTTETSQNIMGLCVGTYNVTVYDSNSPANACYEIGTQVIGEPAAETYTNSSNDATCGLATGTATINVTTVPSSSSYEYTWFSDAGLTNQIGFTAASVNITNTQMGLAAGTYYVQVENASGCTDVIAVTVSDNGSPTLNLVSSTDILCNGGNNGQISLDITGTLNPNYTYTWELNGAALTTTGPTNSTTEQQTSLLAGTYDITVTDNAGCQSSVNVVIAEPSLMTGSISVVDANCSTLGSLTANAANGTGAYTYQWDNDGIADVPASDPQSINVGTGAYNVTVYDANLCELALSATVNDIGGITATATVNSHTLCNGSSEGSITASPTGGTGPFTYAWTITGYTGVNTATYSDLPAGTYNCVVTDVNGCSANTSETITEPSELHFIFVDSTMVSCFSGTNGDITVNGIGGTMPYTFNWNLAAANQTTAQASNLGAGCYTVTVEDNNHCTEDTTICIHEPTQLVLVVDVYSAHCDQADGSASVNISGGTAPYPTITWSSGTATAQADSISGLAFGSYSVTVLDFNGCQEIINFNIDSIARGIITIANYTDVSCFGENDASVQVSVGGGGGANSYLWSPVGFTDGGATYSDLTIGTYNVTATDIWGCELFAQQTIIEPNDLLLTINSLDDRCAGTCEGAADAIVSGGTAPYSYQWDNSLLSTTSGINNLCMGWYRLTVTDAHGCSVIDSVEIAEPLAISLTAVIDSSSCSQSDGKITCFPINGVAPYTFAWSPNPPPGSIVDSLENIPQGSYCVTVTDSKNCPFDTCFVVVDQNSPTVQIDSIFNPLCNGDNNGIVYASSTGGVQPYVWNWNSDSMGVVSVSNIATNLDGGNVCVTVTDVNGCQSTACTTLVENPQLIVNITTTDVLCQSDSTGEAASVVIGGTGLGTYTYLWNGLYTGTSPDQAQALGLISGTYSLLVTDTNGCTNLTNNIIISEPTHISLSSSFTAVLCNGASDGTGTIIPSGGEGTYTYIWPDGQTSITATGLSAGSYTPTITDGNGCVDSTIISISEPTPFVLDSIISQDISCYGYNDANIVTYVSGGTLNYTFQYDGPSGYTASTQTISNLGLGGTYDIHIEDANHCFIDTFHTVNQPPQLEESHTFVNESCYNYCNGSINIDTLGGMGIPSIAWSDLGVTGFNPVDLCPGDYSFTITDENLCTITNMVTILGNPLLDIIESSVTDAACGECDGEATVSLYGGVAPYTVGWFGVDFSSCTPATPYPDGGNHLTETGLPQGIHSVYVEDFNGCRDTVDIVINNLSGPVITSVDTTNVICHGDATGTIQVTVSGGTPTIFYTWDAGTTGSTLINNSLIQPNVYAGTYHFSVTDGMGCVASEVIEIEENPALLMNITNITDVTCNGYDDGSATIQGFGGTGIGTYSYSWSSSPVQTAVTATGLAAASYQAILTDANGCTTNQVFNISEPPIIGLASQNVTQTTCAYPQICDGTITVAATGGNSSAYNYNWFGNGSNQNSIGALCPGAYQLQVTDLDGCYGDFPFYIGAPDTIKVILGQDPIACNDPNGMVWIEAISGGTGNAYFNTVSDNRDDIYPLGGPNGWTCTWDVEATQLAYVNDVYNQTYSVQVYDPNNTQCSVVQSVTVGEVPEPYLFSQQTEQTSCNGVSDGKVRIEVKQGTMQFDYSWQFGSNIPFLQNSDTVLITNIAAGTYTLTVTDDNGCQVPTSFIIIEPNPISVDISMVPEQTLCINQTAVLYANAQGGTPPYNYDWQNSEATWSVLSAEIVEPINDTIVYVRIKDKYNCPADAQKVIFVNDSLQVSIVDNGLICEGESFILNVTSNIGGNGNYQYHWSSGSDNSTDTITPSLPHFGVADTLEYTLTFSDNCGTPEVSETVQITVNPNPYVQTISKRDSCEPLGMTFIPYPENNTYTYKWNFGDPNSSNNESNKMYPSHYFQYAGVYDISLDLTSNEGCTSDTTFENWITVYPLPNADFGMTPNPASLFNNTVSFMDITETEDAIDNIQWDFGNGEKASYLYIGSVPKSTYDHPGYYDIVLFAETRNGCKDTVTRVLRVNDEYRIYAPDAFSPGQDGRNDYFFPLGHGIDGTKDYQLTVYDRWGIVIYQTDVMPYGTDKKHGDYDADQLPEDQKGWNGKYQNTGEYVQNDVYTWAIKLVDVNGVSHEQSGKVTVIR